MAWNQVWEDIFRNHVWGKYPGEHLIRFVAHNFYKAPDRKTIKILEVGCGPGANLWYLAREGFSAYGIEGSETAVKRARERLDAECPGWNGEVVTGDIMRLPWKDQFFDAVIDNAAICCNLFEDSQAIYQEMYRVTKEGGRLVSKTLANGCWGDGIGKQVGPRTFEVSEGPLQGEGYVRFTDFDRIPDLIGKFRLDRVELLTYSLENRRHEIREWFILGTRKEL